MFPFRRGGGKKRGKPQGGQGQGRDRRQGGQGGGRRIPNSAAELLGALQPTTKSLAQVLAGNTRASGQVVHARNVLAQAERLVDERAVDRLPPKQREEFLEQLARLKLTLADADDAAEAEVQPAAPPAPPASMDRLRELALSIATGGPAPGQPEPMADELQVPDQEADASDVSGEADVAAADQLPEPETEEAAARRAARAKRGGTLRLKTVRQETSNEEPARRPSAEAVR
jgi:hypothetical protein